MVDGERGVYRGFKKNVLGANEHSVDFAGSGLRPVLPPPGATTASNLL